jgi:hypothetical protein
MHSRFPNVTVTKLFPSVLPEGDCPFSIPHENPKYASVPPKIRVITSHNAKFLIRHKDDPYPVLTDFPLDSWPAHLVPATSHPNLPPLVQRLPLTKPIKPSTDSYIYFGTNSLEARQRLWDGEVPTANMHDVTVKRWGKLSHTFCVPSNTAFFGCINFRYRKTISRSLDRGLLSAWYRGSHVSSTYTIDTGGNQTYW